MKFSLLILGAPNSSGAPLSALHFAQAVIAEGHEIYRVFFYQDGVYTGNDLAIQPQDEFDLTAAWHTFSLEHHIELSVCIASALRRGMLDPAEAKRNGIKNRSLSASFQISGLGQLIDAGIQADRLITFRA